jgi:hypothetical protein
MNVSKRAAVAANRRTGCAQDDDIVGSHGIFIVVRVSP